MNADPVSSGSPVCRVLNPVYRKFRTHPLFRDYKIQSIFIRILTKLQRELLRRAAHRIGMESKGAFRFCQRHSFIILCKFAEDCTLIFFLFHLLETSIHIQCLQTCVMYLLYKLSGSFQFFCICSQTAFLFF